MEKLFVILKSVLAMIAPSLKKEDSKHGVKETKEALVAVNEIALLIAKRFKDGVGLDDATAIWDKLTKDGEFKTIVQAGYDKYALIPDELTDVDAGEGIELASTQLDFVPRFIATFKKEEAPVEKVAELGSES